MNNYFYLLIFITGLLSTYTDIAEKKIKNIHLLFIFIVTIIVYFILFLSDELTLAPHLVLNPLIGLMVGLILYVSGLFKGGDAKLFFTYSLLLPVNKYNDILPFSCLVLFFNIFIIGFLFLLPLCVKDIIQKKHIIIKKVLARETVLYFGKTILVAFAISWLIGPILIQFYSKSYFFLMFIIVYLGYLTIFRFMDRIKYKGLVFIMIAAGCILRYILNSESFRFATIISYLKNISIFSAIFYLLRMVTAPKESGRQRIPFAPFMFLGAILSNTNFLRWIIEIRNYLKC